MKRTAIISDIHSNWQALQAVWERIEDLGIDRVFCLGDVVGYGARPVDCLEFLRQRDVPIVQGNHDALVGIGSGGMAFNEISLKAVHHNREKLSDEQLDFLSKLPTRLDPEPHITLAHGAPHDRDKYLMGLPDFHWVASKLLEESGPGVCFFGHTHHPMVFDGHRNFIPGNEPVTRNPDEVMLMNPGSVGQPRDRDSRAAFLYWDHLTDSFHFERVQYDIDSARREILDAGLPERLASRLLEGR